MRRTQLSVTSPRRVDFHYGLHSCGAAKRFSQGLAEHDRRDYRAHGPNRTTRLLVEALEAEGIKDLALLDIGGGVGVVQHKLPRPASATPSLSRPPLLICRRIARRRSGKDTRSGSGAITSSMCSGQQIESCPVCKSLSTSCRTTCSFLGWKMPLTDFQYSLEAQAVVQGMIVCAHRVGS